MFEASNNELQDILMCESFFDDFATSNNLNNNNSNTIQPPSATLSEFEAQIRAMLEANNNDLGNIDQIQQNSPNNSIQDFNNFQYSDNPLFHSPDTDTLASLSPSSDSFLNSYNSFDGIGSLSNTPSPPSLFHSPDTDTLASLSPSSDSFLNSYNSFDDIDSLSNTPSPPPFNLQDFIVSPNDYIIKGSMEDPLLTSSEDFNNSKKRVNSPFDRNSSSPDKSLKKKRNGGISKSIKKSSGRPKDNLVKHIKDEQTSISSILEKFVRDKPTLASNILEQFIKGDSDSDISRNDDASQSIVIPNSPIVPSDSSFSDYDSMLVDDGSSTAKSPINRLKSTITNQQNKQRKVAHNAIERRYRNNINDCINDLKNVVPALCHLKSKDDDDIEEVDGIPAATRLNKATILGKATEYITYLKNNNQKMKHENEILKKLIGSIPSGIEIYNTYMAEQPVGCDEPNNGCYTPTESSPGSSDNEQPTPPIGNAGSRALMALFMCMTFFTSPSSYITQTHPADHHHEGRVLTNTLTPELNVNDGTFTIDFWYIIRIVTFLLCLTYILLPSLSSSQPRRVRNSRSIIASVLSAKTKNSKVLYKSLSSLSNGLPVNTFKIIIGLISEFIKFFLRRFIRWDITSGSLTDYEERLLEVALWGRIGEVELCGGNDNVSRLSILYNCLRTINLLESTYTRKFTHLNPSRIYANAALQSYIGLSSFPFLARKVVSHFWNLANKEKVHNSDSEEKWLEIALNSDQQSEMWKGTVDRINDHIFKKANEEKSDIELMKNVTVPLTLMTDVQAMYYLKQAFYNFISIKFNRKIRLSRNQQSFSFLGLVKNTTSNSFAHWYSLVGCCIEAFSLGNTVLGEKFVNRLRDRSTIISGENNYDKQIIAMGLLSYALLMHGKLEASIRCVNKASIDLAKRKEQRNGDGDGDEKLEFLDDYSCKLEQDIHYLAEFCIGWVVLEVKILGWKIVEGLSSASKNSMKSSDEKSPSDATATSSTTTTPTLTNKLPDKLPNLLNNERLQNAIILWTRHLRKLSNSPVFDNIAEVREIFIKKLVILERSVRGDQDFSDDDLYSPDEDEESNNQQHNRDVVTNNTSRSLSESENRAIKSWNILKKM